MSDGVFTRDKRFTFVKGWLTGGTDPMDGSVEVGSGTDFCLLVNGSDVKHKLDKLAEIFYRVMDARISGETTVDYGFAIGTLTVASDDMPADFYSGTNADVIVQRAYGDNGAPPNNITSERKIWSGDVSTPTRDPGSIIPRAMTHGIATGFTQYAESFVLPVSGYYPYGDVNGSVYVAAIEVAFGGRVAVTGNGNPLDPANEIWIEFGMMGFTWDTPGPGLVDVDVTTKFQGDPDEAVIGQFTLELAEGDSVSCDVINSRGAVYSCTCTLKMTPVTWWPYNRLADPTAVWDTATGELVSVGAPFASFSTTEDNSDLYLLLF